MKFQWKFKYFHCRKSMEKTPYRIRYPLYNARRETHSANQHIDMMTSSNGNIFRVTGPLCWEFTGYRWIPLTKPSNAELWCFLWSAPWINGKVSNREAGDLRRHRAHYDVIVTNPSTVSSIESFVFVSPFTQRRTDQGWRMSHHIFAMKYWFRLSA